MLERFALCLAVLAGCRDSPAEHAQAAVAAIARDASADAEITTALSAAPLRRTLEPHAVHRYSLAMKRGESCALVVTQDGVDVAVDVLAPGGTLVATVDSPNGRHGDEPVEIIATVDGEYRVVVRPVDANEPAGSYLLSVSARRDIAATEALLADRMHARELAAAWLRERSGSIELRDTTLTGPGLDRFDLLARRSRVIGLGEATHGSRQLGDVRLALTRRLIERHGVRVIGLEASASRMRLIDRWAHGKGGDLEAMFGSQWINRRTFHLLATEVRAWNAAHSDDPVMLIGLDDQDNAPARDIVAAFAARAYSTAFARRVADVLARVAKADAQASVFGPSDIAADDWRFLAQLLAAGEAHRPLLTARFGAETVDEAIAAVRTLAQFAEFNTDAKDDTTVSRDWTMASNLLRAMTSKTRATYWGHNAHVKHPRGPASDRAPAGGLLAEVLADQYAAVATSFAEGGFLAQLPNDPGDRLQTFMVPAANHESIDGVLSTIGNSIVVWPDGAGAPAWLDAAQPMHWFGALFSTSSVPVQWTRDAKLLADYDGIVFLRHVDAEASAEIGKNRAP